MIVVGSGIGGLTAAATLAKAGKKVLVLEQHDQAGGCCHTYIEKGFEFDVGKICSHWFLLGSSGFWSLVLDPAGLCSVLLIFCRPSLHWPASREQPAADRLRPAFRGSAGVPEAEAAL